MEKITRFIQKNFKKIIFVFCLIGFILLAEDVFNKELMNGDVIGYKFISTYLMNDNVTKVMKIITWFGSGYCFLTITLLLFILVKNKKICFYNLFNLVTVTSLNQLLKLILHRPRPDEFQIITETGYSFPSGHSMVSLAFYGYLVYLIYKYINNKHLKRTLIIILSVLICVIGVSRIYLGVHYTSDVLGGFLISFAYLIIYIELVNKFVLEKNKDDRKE